MKRPLLPLAVVALVALSACSAKGTNDATGAPAEDASASIDGGNPAEGGPNNDGAEGCTLGTFDHCGTCATVCPGVTDDKTLLVCSNATAAGKCDITCRGEFYDLDGVAANGCEADGGDPHGIKEAAILESLPDSFDADGGTSVNPLNVVGAIFGDNRVHEIAPASRPLGREAWYKVSVIGVGGPDQMTACLSISTLPLDNTFEVCITETGGDIFDATKGCKTVKGGPVMSACVSPPSGGDSGVYYVKVRKVEGSNNPNGYSLFLKH